MREVIRYNEYVFTVSDVLSPAECLSLIAASEERGYGKALIRTDLGMSDRPDLRNHARLIVDEADNAALLWSRIQPHVPATVNGRKVDGTDERLRYFRYDAGQQFKAHFDGINVGDDGRRNVYAYMVYLNDDFDGGETRFLDIEQPSESINISPQQGMALLFEPNVLHAGLEVTRGRKYAVRTDVMYI